MFFLREIDGECLRNEQQWSRLLPVERLVTRSPSPSHEQMIAAPIAVPSVFRITSSTSVARVGMVSWASSMLRLSRAPTKTTLSHHRLFRRVLCSGSSLLGSVATARAAPSGTNTAIFPRTSTNRNLNAALCSEQLGSSRQMSAGHFWLNSTRLMPLSWLPDRSVMLSSQMTTSATASQAVSRSGRAGERVSGREGGRCRALPLTLSPILPFSLIPAPAPASHPAGFCRLIAGCPQTCGLMRCLSDRCRSRGRRCAHGQSPAHPQRL